MMDIIKNMYPDSRLVIKLNMLNGVCTDFFNIKRGVIQGNTLRPILFNLLINHIPCRHIYDKTKIHHLFCNPPKLVV